MTLPKFIPPTLLERVQAKIAAQPKINTRDLAIALEVKCCDLEVPLQRLRAAGKIHRSNGLDERRAKWVTGAAPDYDEYNPSAGIGQPRQRVVSAWPAGAPRDPWGWALHGAQP